MQRASIISTALALAIASGTPTMVHGQLAGAALDCTRGNAVQVTGASACRGTFQGNDRNQQAGVMAQLHAFGGTWSLLGSSDDDGKGPFATDPKAAAGTLTFDELLRGPFALILKASDSFSLYYFLNDGQGISSVAFSTAGTAVNKQGLAQELSHATLYRSTVSIVPEPASAALVAAGLVLLGAGSWTRRRA